VKVQSYVALFPPEKWPMIYRWPKYDQSSPSESWRLFKAWQKQEFPLTAAILEKLSLPPALIREQVI
jgi:hypothetical protein